MTDTTDEDMKRAAARALCWQQCSRLACVSGTGTECLDWANHHWQASVALSAARQVLINRGVALDGIWD